MPALAPTDITGEVVWIGHVPDRDASLRSITAKSAQLTYAGIPGEAHGGLTRPACVRVRSQHSKGTEIRNVRQLSVMSAEDLTEIAADCDLAEFDPAHIGASLVIAGIPDFTHLPPSSRLQFPDGSAIVIDMENRPCHLPAKVINAEGEFQAAERLKQAAEIMTPWPMAMQIRFLQALTEVATENNSRIVFPLSLELLKPFMNMTNQK